jgi:hypothetical protein
VPFPILCAPFYIFIYGFLHMNGEILWRNDGIVMGVKKVDRSQERG